MRARGPADEDVDRVDRLAVDLGLDSEKADVGHRVVAAARRAARPVDADGLAIVDLALERLREFQRARLGLDHGEVAELDAGAAHQSAHDRRGVVAKNLQQGLGRQIAELRVGHVGDDDVLVRREPHLTGAISLGEPRDLFELIARDTPHRDREPDVAQRGVLLAEDSDVIGRPG